MMLVDQLPLKILDMTYEARRQGERKINSENLKKDMLRFATLGSVQCHRHYPDQRQGMNPLKGRKERAANATITSSNDHSLDLGP